MALPFHFLIQFTNQFHLTPHNKMPSSSDNFKPIYGQILYVLLALTLISSLDVVVCDTCKAKPADTVDAPLLTMKISANRTIKVAQEGGEFSSVQAAINSVPSGNTKWVTIHVRRGVYRY